MKQLAILFVVFSLFALIKGQQTAFIGIANVTDSNFTIFLSSPTLQQTTVLKVVSIELPSFHPFQSVVLNAANKTFLMIINDVQSKLVLGLNYASGEFWQSNSEDAFLTAQYSQGKLYATTLSNTLVELDTRTLKVKKTITSLPECAQQTMTGTIDETNQLYVMYCLTSESNNLLMVNLTSGKYEMHSKMPTCGTLSDIEYANKQLYATELGADGKNDRIVNIILDAEPRCVAIEDNLTDKLGLQQNHAAYGAIGIDAKTQMYYFTAYNEQMHRVLVAGYDLAKKTISTYRVVGITMNTEKLVSLQ